MAIATGGTARAHDVLLAVEQTDVPEFRWVRAALLAWSKEPQRLVRAPAAGAEARQLRP